MHAGPRDNIEEPRNWQAKASNLNIFKRLRTSSAGRPQSYHTVNGVATRRHDTAWYWRLVAVASSFMILGGFLMLPTTFDRDPQTRISQAVIGIFAVALLAAGISFTALLCFAVRSPEFQADSVFLPAFTSCSIGLLTVLYNFTVFRRYHWNTPALLVTVCAAVGTILYGGLLVWTQRKVGAAKTRTQEQQLPVPMTHLPSESQTALTQEQVYQQNYNRNMFPTAYSREGPPATPNTGYDPESITEEEMQRQQMLMLLLNKDSPSVPDTSSSTFRIDWQGREEEDTPAGGWYAPQSSASSAYPQSAFPTPGISRQGTNELRPWDGVWREVRQPRSQDLREARRREIEESSRRS
ncbi:hypothetical protein CKM354_000950400 [Cercospora kikuchii]|uniref:Uncharacterized protein n=1 Tax=Cercospora kikuchii TaxID=84275 RepID=A0A9P3CND2_9PEZI|nr:uncharacterized protein CKM354_000950400 [Cercospora kikuchii]GIZ46377.1 hypothetical protein CKM354_000950400 [Cercospora kikuchii]